ncbi:omega-amidase [Pseudohyphozyma bogoriensis]|nr:omega-amidase [Pseudohyphozyma bogoriensis]
MPASAPSLAPFKASDFSVALIQMGGTGDDKAANLQLAKSKIAEAVAGAPKKPDLVVLPEVFNSPYAATSFPKYAEVIGWDPSIPKGSYDIASSKSESIQLLSAAAKEHGIWLVGGSIPELGPDGKIYNSSPTFSPSGDLVAVHRKVHLFDIDIPGGITFKESETLTGGDWVTIVETDFGKIAVSICYDIRFPELAMIAARQGCVAMIIPAAFNPTTGPLHWDLLQKARAIDNQMYIIMCSPARATSGDGYKAYGYSGVTDPMGKITAQLKEEPGILYSDISVEDMVNTRARIPVTVQRRFDVYTDVSA